MEMSGHTSLEGISSYKRTTSVEKRDIAMSLVMHYYLHEVSKDNETKTVGNTDCITKKEPNAELVDPLEPLKD